MATKLDDLKFNDYTLKGVSNDSDGHTFTLGHYDVIQDEYTEDGATKHDTVIACDYSTGSTSFWRFHGVSDYASTSFLVGSMGDGSSGVFYDASSDVWKFKGVANKALGFMTTTGSDNYMLFNDYFEVPNPAWQEGETATLADIQSWIDDFMDNLGENYYLTKISMA